jgi:NADPH oxidase 2
MQIFSLFKPTKSKAWLLIFALAQIITFTAAFIHTSTHPFYTLFKSTTGVGFPLAKASAASLMLSTALILFPICRNIITRVRRTFLVRFIPFEGVVGFHRVIGMSIVVFSFIHVCAHFNNSRLTTAESGVDPAVAIWSNPTNLTGLVLVVVLMLITTSSKQHIKRTNYDIFFYTHHLYSV